MPRTCTYHSLLNIYPVTLVCWPTAFSNLYLISCKQQSCKSLFSEMVLMYATLSWALTSSARHKFEEYKSSWLILGLHSDHLNMGKVSIRRCVMHIPVRACILIS